LGLGASQVSTSTCVRIPDPHRFRDTVSSIGVVRGKSLPGTDEFNDSICYFRHALALDERRVKFLPEYICGGESHIPTTDGTPPLNRRSGNDLVSGSRCHAKNVSSHHDPSRPLPATQSLALRKFGLQGVTLICKFILLTLLL
jgi:uncharacterized protein (DUF2235 family)